MVKRNKKKSNLRNGESNPGHLRDRQRCYQLHHIGRAHLEYLGFDPSTSSLLRTHASDCANTPVRWPYDTRDSHVVPYRSTDRAQRCLTSQFRWDAVLSPWYDRMTNPQPKPGSPCRWWNSRHRNPKRNKKVAVAIQHPRFPRSPLP